MRMRGEYEILKSKVINRLEKYLDNHDYKTAIQALRFIKELEKDD